LHGERLAGARRAVQREIGDERRPRRLVAARPVRVDARLEALHGARRIGVEHDVVGARARQLRDGAVDSGLDLA
jgi:hypothetical protein